MLRLPEFSYLAARTVAEAVAALAQTGPGAIAIAGGTDLVPNLKRRQFPVQVLVSLQGIRDLHGIRPGPDGGLVIGALTTLSEVTGNSEVRAAYPALFEAAAQVATPAIRSAATLGGNLLVDTRCQYYNQTDDWREALGHCMKCDSNAPCRVAPNSPRCLAVSQSDTAPALIALSARVRLVSERGEREIPLVELYQDDGIKYTARAWDEILTEIILPATRGLGSTYLKLRRRGAFDFPILGVGAALSVAEDGVVKQARLVLGAVASRPVLVLETEGMVGKPLDEAAFVAVSRAAARQAKPMDNADLTLAYRKRMVQVFTVRALRKLAWGESGVAQA